MLRNEINNLLYDTKYTKNSLQCILDNIYSCLIMCCGGNEFKNITNIQPTKIAKVAPAKSANRAGSKR